MKLLRGFLVLVVIVLGAGLPSSASGGPSLAAPATLSYVQSSNGLSTPALEGGNTELELADLNGDGHLDLISIGDHGSPYVNTDEHGIMVWFGDGAGNWSVFQNGDFGYGGIAVGDVNNDGLMDVGYGMHHNYSGQDFGDQLLEVALGDGTGRAWTPWDDGLATNGETWGMFNTDFADVNHDGRLDVGSLSFGCCAGVHVYLNQGDGTWVQSFGFLGGNADFNFVFGDVNADGFPDFAVSQQAGTVYLGDGQGGFSLADGNLPPRGSSGRPGVDLGDVNGDGRDDLSFCNASGGIEVWTWAGNNTWQDFGGALPGSGSCEATQIRDMNVDGHGDVVAFGNGLVQVWTGDGAGNWTLAGSFTTPSPGYKSAFRVGGDADHNGYPDIALVSDEGSYPNDQNHLRFYKEASVPAALSIAPMRPRGGETLYAGSVRFLDWVSAVPGNVASSVAVELSVAGAGGPWQPVASDLPNNGRYQWRLPSDLPNTSDAFLRYTVTTASGSASAVTPAAFTIAGGVALPTMHVDSIKLKGLTPPNYLMKAGVRIVDAAGTPVAHATVTLKLTPPAGPVKTKSVLTNAKGIAQTSWGSRTGGTWQACVEDVQAAGYLYDPGQNVITCKSVVYP